MNDSSVTHGALGSDSRGPSVVTIGVFDGVHRGHRTLISTAKAEADAKDLPLTVITFDPHPMSVVRPEAGPCRLADLGHRVRLLQEAGADHVRVIKFDAALAQMPPEDFVAEFIVGEQDARVIVTGEDFRFGHRAAGDVDLLARLGADKGFRVIGVPLAADESAVWSSTRIRELIGNGDVTAAEIGLTRPHRVVGEVVVGDRRGRQLGYPTANLAIEPGICVPADGVYAAWAVLEPDTDAETVVPAAVSVGANSTFGGTESRVEAFLLDGADWDLYGQRLGIDFVARLRGMVTFPSVDALLDAMSGDVLAARRILTA